MTQCGTYIHSTICIHLVVWHHCFLQSKHFDRRQHRFFCFFAGRRQKEQAMPSYPRLSLGSHLRPFSFVFSSSDVGFWRAGRLGCVFRRQIECGLRFAGAGGFPGGGMAAGEQRWLLLWGISWRQSPRAILKLFLCGVSYILRFQAFVLNVFILCHPTRKHS